MGGHCPPVFGDSMKVLKRMLLVLACLVVLLGAAVALFFATYQATVSFDVSEKTGAVLKGASGYLYGIAENGVPSAEMVESLDVKTVAQKVPGGLQHPIGDMDNAAKMLTDADYQVVYLQDMYDTWYYLHDAILQQRSDGTYDWQQLLNEDYLPKVELMTKELMQKPYAEKIVYCLYNECDNGIWFGETQQDTNPDNPYGVWCNYNDVGKANFNQAWLQTYTLVKAINPDALIGGPGFFNYDRAKLEVFLTFCKENNCVPDVMIYHELDESTIYFFDEHIREYRALEQELGISELPIIITEYGMMSENGYPGIMAQIITQFETNKVYGDNAYWRLADNLNDTCADNNSPNAEWWLMRWYTEMKGETVKATNKDVLSSNFKNYFKYHLDALSFNGFMGIASVADDGSEIDVVCGGGERKSRIQLKNLDATALYGKQVRVRVEETVYKGLYGIVNKPVVIRDYVTKAGKSLTVEIGRVDSANAYHIVVTAADGSEQETTEARPDRYEFENGTLLGKAYTYDSYAPASGGTEEHHELVGGMENEGDGVEVSIDIPADGEYRLDFIYGNSNDGPFGENGRQNPDDRSNTEVELMIDGESKEAVHLFLPNTIRSEYTSCYPVFRHLSKGTHTVAVSHVNGTYVLDSLLVSPYDVSSVSVAVLADEDKTTDSVQSYLAVAPQDGYYALHTDAAKAVIDGADITAFDNVFLKKGLNYIDLQAAPPCSLTVTKTTEDLPYLGAEDAALADGAVLAELDGEAYIDGISSVSGSAAFTVRSREAGKHRLTITYANNDEGGVHDYNVDLIERYVTVSVNGKKVGNVYCRNTYSWQTKNTATCTVELQEGINTITLTNDGAERFNGKDTFAPHLYGISVNDVQK